MGAETGISWCDMTFNPWWGCTRLSEACRRCYAATWAKRHGTDWGPEADRRFFSDNHWNEPRKWNRKAERDGVRRRVFCASMADVFEDREDLWDPRYRLWSLIDETPNLIWMILTKRPENIRLMIPHSWLDAPPKNIWWGATIEQQRHLNRYSGLAIPAEKRFLSLEPLLENMDLEFRGTRPKHWKLGVGPIAELIDLVIVGGESGSGARPMRPEWARSIRQQCFEFGIAYHLKQWGEHDCSGSRVGKKAAGRMLDGRLYDEIPDYEGKETASV